MFRWKTPPEDLTFAFQTRQNFGRRAIEIFRDAGHDVVTVAEQGSGGASDSDLIQACRTEDRVLVTLDLDFSNVLRFPPERYAGIAVLRVLHPVELRAIHERARVLLERVGREELSGGLWIVEAGRIRQYDPEA